jgi:hypothetical protein
MVLVHRSTRDLFLEEEKGGKGLAFPTNGQPKKKGMM